MSDLADSTRAEAPGQFRSQSERKLAETLARALAAPLVWEYEPNLTRTFTTAEGASFGYRPDFVIRNQETGRVLAVELKTSQGLSRANLMKFKLISDAYHKDGEDFLLIVDGEQDSSAVRSLSEGQVQTAWLDDVTEGAAVRAIRDGLSRAGGRLSLQ